jgi:hypothetical protein
MCELFDRSIRGEIDTSADGSIQQTQGNLYMLTNIDTDSILALVFSKHLLIDPPYIVTMA